MIAVVILTTLLGAEPLAPSAHAPALFPHNHLADYDAELRLPNAHVDTDAMVKRLKELGVTTYYWLIWHAATDWEDLKEFLPKAAKEGIEVWVYLVPPTESPPKFGNLYSEPFRLDYRRWAVEIARLSLQHRNLTAWVIDDFYANHEFFTPAYVRDIRAESKAINARLAFLPLMYLGEIRPQFVEDYRGVIDGVVVAYLQDREEIDRTWAMLNDAPMPPQSEFSYPWNKPSRVGDYGLASQTAKVLPGDRYDIQFLERDDFTGPTTGYHYKQLLLDRIVVWEQDVAGGTNAWHKVTVDVTRHVRGKANVALAFRLFDKKAVSNFGVHWRVAELHAKNLRLTADLKEPQIWQVSQQGAFESGFASRPKVGQPRFHIPFISMTAGDHGEFRLRHGSPATPERIAEQLRVSLQAWRDGNCDGVVTYCLDKRPQSKTFAPVQKVLGQFAETVASQPPHDFNIKIQKPDDQVRVKIEEDAATFDVISPSGIGGAKITATNGNWPKTVVLRFRLRGLEWFSVANGKGKLTGSILSHSGNAKLLHLTEEGKADNREPGTEVKVLDAAGKPVTGLPKKGGYFEITVPKALLEGNPNSLELGWIDFYRG